MRAEAAAAGSWAAPLQDGGLPRLAGAVPAAGPGGARCGPAERHRPALRGGGLRDPSGLRRLQLRQADGPVRAARR